MDKFASEAMDIPTPTLTFDPFPETKQELESVKEEKIQETPILEESNLSPEERAMVENFSNQIDLTNSGMILQYGVGAQKKIVDFSESALENVKTKDLGEIGEMLSGVVSELKSFDAEEESKGIFGFF